MLARNSCGTPMVFADSKTVHDRNRFQRER